LRQQTDEIAAFFQSSDQWALRQVIEHFNGRVNYEEAADSQGMAAGQGCRRIASKRQSLIRLEKPSP
jgi:predicted transcriptional regulator